MARSRTMAGRLMRNTEPHQKCSSSTPLMIGPTVTPAVRAADQIATALVRSTSSWNRLRMRARVDGIRVAPAIPSTARAAMSISADCAYAASSDAALNATAPMSSSRRRPMRSPTEPIVEQAGEHEPVDVEDPRLLRRGRLEVLRDERHREEEDGHVHRRDEDRQDQHGEPDPLATSGM